ncbi:hypothetical protein BOTBODRAFT_192591 [Botryobasidium botryosum FD-172 SS1]|uniref:Succinate dehydrogenase assembly factor 4, mitochondrial n=1 Tax=Botryobasidium botryosum (strain FD-172 SS1) TaxID=930990 RepID=A0A067LXW1_BOTB1|nr:hypothetical protein BOTBODRAFT_192591 [Botryobasidium botryosum FD-172 SS1]
MFRSSSVFRAALARPRRFSSFTHALSQPPSIHKPGPPPLPAEDQREFEELVRLAGRAPSAKSDVPPSELHPDAPRSPPPEFEGDVNPITGEKGGPKREPVKHGDWSHAGRVTDF